MPPRGGDHEDRYRDRQQQRQGGASRDRVDRRPQAREASEQPHDSGTTLHVGPQRAEVTGESGDDRAAERNGAGEHDGREDGPENRLHEVHEAVVAEEVDGRAGRDP